MLGAGGRRVVVLDDGEIMRKGRCGAFQDAEDFELVGCGPTTRAGSWPDAWRDVDVVVVEAYRQSDTFDRFVGVQVVEQVRALAWAHRPTIFVVGLAASLAAGASLQSVGWQTMNLLLLPWPEVVLPRQFAPAAPACGRLLNMKEGKFGFFSGPMRATGPPRRRPSTSTCATLLPP